jgi:putative membrane protein
MKQTEAEKPPLPGANSFTEEQARKRIAKEGFDDVQQLTKDEQGVWRGQAKKSGQQVSVALDYRGNVVQQ